MNTTKTPQKPIIFWVLWLAILNGLIMIYVILGQSPQSSASQSSGLPLGLIVGLPPLIFSIITRWALLPRIDNPSKALGVFIVGMAMAEGCGIIGIFLGGAQKNLLVIAALVGILQYIPFFASRFGQERTAPPHTKIVK